jgi:hypothetical protein
MKVSALQLGLHHSPLVQEKGSRVGSSAIIDTVPSKNAMAVRPNEMAAHANTGSSQQTNPLNQEYSPTFEEGLHEALKVRARNMS